MVREQLLPVVFRGANRAPAFGRALAIREKQFGPDHPDLAPLLSSLAGARSYAPPMTLADDVRVHIQMLWGSIGWATGAAFGIALADPNRRTILITGEGSHQLTANEIGNMGRYGANPIILVLNNDGYMVERALEPYPDWSYNDLAKWRYADLPRALGCADWTTARVETIGELDAG